MNYYEHHLGDYAKDTAHLTMIEHGAYRLLLDRYYGTETGIPADQTYRLARARSKEEKQAVDDVLNEFFSLIDGVWINKRADQEISKATIKINAAKENGRKGGRPKKAHLGSEIETQEKPTGLFVGSEIETQQKAHQTPDTRHQTPDVKTHTTVPTVAGAVCVALRSEGMAQVNPSHPELLTLLEQGAKIEEFVNAGRIAREKGKGFAYVLGIVKGQIADAKRMAEETANAPPTTPRKVKDQPWWVSEQSINAKAATLGLRARPGEDMANFKGRIEEAIRKSEGAHA